MTYIANLGTHDLAMDFKLFADENNALSSYDNIFVND